MSKSKTDKSILAAQDEYKAEVEQLRENWVEMRDSLRDINALIREVIATGNSITGKGSNG